MLGAMKVGKNKQGFTIVELLIVVVVIAILAAITIVAYNGIQNRTHDSAVQADLKNLGTQAGRVHAETGSYPLPGSTTTAPAGVGTVKASKNSYTSNTTNFYYCVSNANDKFTIAGRSKSGKTWVYYSNGGIREFTPAWALSSDICTPTLDTSSYQFTYGQSSAGVWFAWVNG